MTAPVITVPVIEEAVVFRGGGDRRFKLCRCAACKAIERCVPGNDFYTQPGKPEGPLYCEACIWSIDQGIRDFSTEGDPK